MEPPPVPSRPVAPIGVMVFVALALATPGDRALAQTPDTLPSPGALKRLSLEQLMDIEVTSVSRRPEKLSGTASAIQISPRRIERGVYGKITWR